VNTHPIHSRLRRALADAVGPREVAALARAVTSLETDELARNLLSAAVPTEWRLA
jgi:hypothetical protein